MKENPGKKSSQIKQAVFKKKVDLLAETGDALFNITGIVAEGPEKRNLNIPRSILYNGDTLDEDPQLTKKDIKKLQQDYIKTLQKLKKSEKVPGRTTGQGFKVPLMYKAKFVRMFENARDIIGTFDAASIESARDLLDRRAADRLRATQNCDVQLPTRKPVQIPSGNSNYIIDRLTMFKGVSTPDGPVKGIATSGVLTPLMTILSIQARMASHAQPPPEVARNLKVKYLIKLARVTDQYKRANRDYKNENKDTELEKRNLIITEQDLGNYISRSKIDEVMNSTSGIGTWSNGQYLGPYPDMVNTLGMSDFDEMSRRSRKKFDEKLKNATDKTRKAIMRESKTQHPSNPNYMTYSDLQVLTSLNTIKDPTEIRSILGNRAGLLLSNDKTMEAERAQLTDTLEMEGSFLTAYLEYLSSRKEKYIGEHAKTRVRNANVSGKLPGTLF